MSFTVATLAIALLSASALADPILPETRARLHALRDSARTWAPLCEDGPLGDGECPYADMTLFSGLDCLAGETARCEDVRRAQGSDGRWWRSPEQVDSGRENSFSRDQTLGLLAYFLATNDKVGAERWLAWVNN